MGRDIEFAKNLEHRTLVFAIKIIHFSKHLGNGIKQKIIRNQLTKAGTSIGANYRDANRSRSKADFKSKIEICLSEASEVQYWMEIIKGLEWANKTNIGLLTESTQLVALFTSILKNL
jgi:four helix bundle protein